MKIEFYSKISILHFGLFLFVVPVLLVVLQSSLPCDALYSYGLVSSLNSVLDGFKFYGAVLPIEYLAIPSNQGCSGISFTN